MRGFLLQVKVFRHTQPTTCLGLVAFALLCVGAPSAMAENCNAPPGTSGIDQYCEAIPSPGGSGGSHHGHKGQGGGGNTQHLSPSTTQTLEHSGAAGATVLALTGAGTSTPPAKKAPSSQRRHKSSKQHQAAAGGQKTPAGTPAVQDTTPAADTSFGVGSSVSGSLGAGFIAVLAGIGLLLAALAWLGRRRAAPGEPARSNG
jgi:hypothetical protein